MLREGIFVYVSIASKNSVMPSSLSAEPKKQGNKLRLNIALEIVSTDTFSFSKYSSIIASSHKTRESVSDIETAFSLKCL